MLLERLAVADELVVGVVASMPAADLAEVRDELDPLDPLDLLEAELSFVAQPQRGAVPKVSGSSFMSKASIVRWWLICSIGWAS